MSAAELRRRFRRRFRATARQIWSLRVGRGVALTVLVAAVLVAAVAAADYRFELSWAARAGMLTGVIAVVAALAVVWVVRPGLAWGRARVAAELEGLFPRLGQRLRTATQHGERSASELAREGVSPGMVAALEEETAEKVKPLPLHAALPVRPVLVAGVLAACAIAGLAAAAVWLPEWRTAVGRVALAPTPYTSLTAAASADAVDEGTDVEIRATMAGRARPDVTLHLRDTGEADWRHEPMEGAEGEYVTRLPKLRVSTEFYVTAGPEQTPVRQVVVRHALKIVGGKTVVVSPAYTGVPPATYDGGSFSAIQGSTVRVTFELDRPAASATLVVKEAGKPVRRVEMAVKEQFVTGSLPDAGDPPLTADLEYAVEARAADGMPLVGNRHRVRVTADQPPTVWFETPGEALEVHTLAEVVLRARARDDFGVAKVGIVFQVNNEEERTLILEDIAEPNRREAKAEQLLMLEQFLLTQKDCVAYYAFAEDARPDGPQRTTTELRFIDIRPFQRIYRLLDAPEEMNNGPRREIIFLDEVIARQRFNLNQTMRLESRAKVKIDLAQVEKIAAFENKLATQTHDLADFLAGLGVDGAAILAQAEESMLSAVDSLNAAKFGTAINQERDALRFLMEARNTVQMALVKQPPKVRAAARQFDRLQRQKLRRNMEQAETLAAIAEELAKLAAEEDEVARDIAGPNPMGNGASGMPEPKARPMPEGTEPKGDGPGPKAEPKAKPEGGEKVEPKAEPKGGDTADPKMPPKGGKGGMDPAQERQDDIAGRAAALEKAAANAKGLTKLAKDRITDAAKAANAGADALGQGDRPTARKEVDRAKELFRAASKQVAALAAEEAAQQLAAARDLANEIAQQAAPTDEMRNAGAGGMSEAKLPGASGMGMNDPKMPMPGLGAAAEQAKTLKDVLEKLAGSGAEGDAEAARKAAGILKQEDLAAAADRLEKVGAGADKAERQDLADRFAALGQKLDQAYRETVAPRLEEIARLEREANELEQRAAAADDAADRRRLRQQGSDFIEKLEAAGLGQLAGDDVRAAVRAGPSAGGGENFSRGIAVIHTKLMAKLQEFVAGDRVAAGSEAVPPEYRDLVERYLRTLSAGGSK